MAWTIPPCIYEEPHSMIPWKPAAVSEVIPRIKLLDKQIIIPFGCLKRKGKGSTTLRIS